MESLSILMLLSLLVGKLKGQLIGDNYPANYIVKDGDTFNFVVVGAGAAGCAAASKLALLKYTVLLVEAGGDPSVTTKVPGAEPLVIGSDVDWKYETIPNNKSCLSLPCKFFRGKCLGGSTSINYMVYTRGNPEDYEYDLPGWTWDDFRPYFLRYEGLQSLNKLPPSSEQYHNTKGVMNVTILDDSDSLWHPRLLDGYKNVGIPQNDDVNAITQIGVGIVPAYVYDGERMSSARGYLTRDDVQGYLKVAKQTICAGVIIENSSATGVKLIQRGGEIKRVYASKEVILSAGTVGTPQILMLSGIGPADHLKEKNIPLQADLPVGDSLKDHFSAVIFGLVNKSNPILGGLSALGGAAVDGGEYIFSQNGSFSTIGLTDLTVFVNTSCYNSETKVLDKGPGCDVPNLQILHVFAERFVLTIGKPFLEIVLDPSPAVARQIAAASAKSDIILFVPLILKPYSTGNIRLASTDPNEHPAITPNFLDDVRDVEQNLEAISIIENLFETPFFKESGAEILRFELDCPDYESDWSGYWSCYTREITNSGLHAVGTAGLGNVVDEKLRVIGISNLRVADLSPLLTVPKGNTEAAALAMGERVVDFVEEDNVS